MIPAWRLTTSSKILVVILLTYCGFHFSKHLLGEIVTVQQLARRTTDTGDDMHRRKDRLELACKIHKPFHTYANLCGHIQENSKLGISWCYVPKAGSTFWKKVFYILQRATEENHTMTLGDIDFRKAHTAPVKNVCSHGDSGKIRDHLLSQQTLLVVRDPYSRLFSAYIDKLYLPDHWGSVGTHIVKTFRKNASEFSKHCGHDVTFEEFIRYVIHVGSTGSTIKWFLDDHWQPISKICLPCQMPYQYISKQETFSRDRDYLLKELKISQFLHGNFSRYEDAIRTVSDRILAYWKSNSASGCMKPNSLAERLWNAFQVQGYLPLDKVFTESSETFTMEGYLPSDKVFAKSSETFTMEGFRQRVINTIKTHIKDDFTAQKSNALVKAYSTLNREQLSHLKSIYKDDFELFGYEKEPNHLYSRFQPKL